jgi:diguanylate cyclase (GGDEF)-like protein
LRIWLKGRKFTGSNERCLRETDMEKPETPKILIVDDRPENLLAMELIFEDEPCDIIMASSGNEALAHMMAHDFALVLLDVQMPDMNGFETAELMRGNRKTEHVPIIFVTAISKEKQHIFKGYETGAVDYLFKPVDSEVLKSKARVFLRLHNQQKTLKNTNNKLHQVVKELENANRKILEQQKAVIEEERLKVLLEMAGATAHELSQPLMVLLCSIELIETCREDPEKMREHLARIQESGRRISEVNRKIEQIQHYEVKVHDSQTQVINFDQAMHILYVDDSVDDFSRVNKILSSEKNISLSHAKTIQEGLSAIRQQERSRIDLIFLDYLLADGTGFDFLEKLEADDVQVPVVIITGNGDEVVSAGLIQAGACEYLPKNRINAERLSRVIYQALEKQRLNMDVKRLQAKLLETSTRDALTGLYNRRYFMEALTAEVERAARYKRNLSLLLIDIDHFKTVNDTWGHPAGDKVLTGIAQQLSFCSRQNDIVGRYGGEEFAVILPDTGPKGARLAGEKVRLAVADTKFTSIEASLQMTASVGIASNTHEKSVEELVEAADKALYQAKENGRNRVESFDASKADMGKNEDISPGKDRQSFEYSDCGS